jgi:hypothetical protein
MLARDRRASALSFHTALSGGKRQVSCVRRLSVNLRGATLEIPGNWQTDVLPGHDRLDGCDLSPQGTHTECGITVAGELQSTQPWGYRLRFFWAAASTPPEHVLSNEHTLGTSTGSVQRQWKTRGPRSGHWTGPRSGWWRGVKGKVCEGEGLTLAVVRGPTAQDNGWNGKWVVEDQGRHVLGDVLGGAGGPPAGPYLKKHISSHSGSNERADSGYAGSEATRPRAEGEAGSESGSCAESSQRPGCVGGRSKEERTGQSGQAGGAGARHDRGVC